MDPFTPITTARPHPPIFWERKTPTPATPPAPRPPETIFAPRKSLPSFRTKAIPTIFWDILTRRLSTAERCRPRFLLEQARVLYNWAEALRISLRIFFPRKRRLRITTNFISAKGIAELLSPAR